MIINRGIQKILFILAIFTICLAKSYSQLGTIEYIDTSECGGDTIPDALFRAKDVSGMGTFGGTIDKLFYLADDTFNHYTYDWDFGNGATDTGTVDIVALYSEGQTDIFYTVSLTETNIAPNRSCIVKRTRQIRYLRNSSYPGGDYWYAYNKKGCRTLTTSFNFIPTSVFDNWAALEWHFGDGETSTEYNPTHTYDSVGIYYPELYVNGSITPAFRESELRITQPPNARFTYLQKQNTNETKILGSFETYFIGNQQYYPDTSYYLQWYPERDTINPISQQYSPNLTSGIPHTYTDSGTYNPGLYIFYNYKENDILVECGSWFDTTIIIRDDLANEFISPNVVILSELSDPDQQYDRFGISTNGSTSIVVNIYSRTGTLIKELRGKNIEWDCRTDQGILLNSGIYFYTIEDDAGNNLLPPDKPAKTFHVFRSDE